LTLDAGGYGLKGEKRAPWRAYSPSPSRIAWEIYYGSRSIWLVWKTKAKYDASESQVKEHNPLSVLHLWWDCNNKHHSTEPAIGSKSQPSPQVKSIDAASNRHRPHGNDIAEWPRHNDPSSCIQISFARNMLRYSTYLELTKVRPSGSQERSGLRLPTCIFWARRAPRLSASSNLTE
jgi:hypothetical protein